MKNFYLGFLEHGSWDLRGSISSACICTRLKLHGLLGLNIVSHIGHHALLYWTNNKPTSNKPLDSRYGETSKWEVCQILWGHGLEPSQTKSLYHKWCFGKLDIYRHDGKGLSDQIKKISFKQNSALRIFMVFSVLVFKVNF